MPELDAQAPADERMDEVIRRLHAAYPDAQCELNFANPLQLLIATILSAQCTDVRVNMVTPALFERYPDAKSLAEAETADVEEMIRSTGFYRNKAKNIQGAARRLVAEYDGEVPTGLDDLLSLPGVARKTANVVLGNAFEIAEGIVVDTHVKRLANRLGFTGAGAPDKVERDLLAITPREEWIDLAHLLIFHGRRVCSARKPACANCVLNDLCPSAEL